MSPDIFYRRNLPHIHPEGHAFFVTFSLLHAIPYDVLEQLKAERQNELRQADLAQRYSIQKKHFGKYDEWLDRCENSPRWLGEPDVAAIVANEIERMNGERYTLIAYCIMLNHVHLLLEGLLATSARHRGHGKISAHRHAALAQRSHRARVQPCAEKGRAVLAAREL